jgi:hypothetical protein
MIWNDEADRILLSLWDEGSSLGIVAERLRDAGYNVSRNAVAGRKHRLRPNAERKMVPKKIIRLKPPPRSNPVTEKKHVTPEIDISQHEGIDYLDLTSHGCKAIMPKRGGAWMLQKVCGLPRYNDGPYCEEHFNLYTNPMPRRAHG